MSLQRTHSDGALAFGSQRAAIFPEGDSANGVNFIFDSFSIDPDCKVLESMDEFGVVYKDVMIEQAITGSAKLQFLALTDKAPGIAWHFKLFPIGSNTANAAEAIAFKIKKPGQAQTQDGEKVCNIDFREKFN